MSGLPGRLVLLGHPVSHSISPRFQNAALRAAGIPLRYEIIDVAPDGLAGVMEELRRENAAGNVTIPHKEAVKERCTRVTALAARCGAVNTFWHDEGKLVGDNTDVAGVQHVTEALLGSRREGARVAILGAGGGAAAVLCAVEGWAGATARVYNRHMARAERLVARFGSVATAVSSLDALLADATLIVNATPIGLQDDSLPLPIGLLPSGVAVFDLVYRPDETAWVRAARTAGHLAADGEGMLVEQGALAFSKWFGIEPDRNAMWRAVH